MSVYKESCQNVSLHNMPEPELETELETELEITHVVVASEVN